MRIVSLMGLILAATASNAVVIYDTLEREYTNGNGNCLGGVWAFGAVHDQQVIDNLTINETTVLTAVTVRNLTFGRFPAVQAYLRIHLDAGGEPGVEMTGPEGDLVSITETDFVDHTFGMSGRDVRAGDLSYALGVGTYWIALQAISDDWHYTTNSQYGMGSSQHGRDGIRDRSGLFISNQWYLMGVDTNMRIEGDVVPEPMTMLALGSSLIALMARRRRI